MYAERIGRGAEAEAMAVRLSGRAGLAWLDGDRAHGEDGRWAFVGSDPVEVRRVGLGEETPLSIFDGLGGSTDSPSRVDGAPPPHRVPRWIGYVAYDAAWSGTTRSTPRIPRRRGVPVAWLGRYDALLAFDLAGGDAFLVGDDRAACERLRRRLGPPRVARAPRAAVGAPRVPPREDHRRAIEAALEHVAAGDVYQVNLARRWTASFGGEPLALWLAMRRASPVPLGLFLDAGDHAVLGRTMERFLGWEGPGGRLESRPIKGTIARRGRDGDEAHALRADPKERAEHAMIVDLMRNDLGRVAVTGSVRVEQVMAVEPYARLSHLVSTVACRTRPEVGLVEVMEATFPPGSVTGAPKVRAVEIIEALEPVPRGVYTGCVGHLDRAGGASWAVAIRTAQVASGRVDYHAGGGLVEASVPAREIAETELKARAFLDAVEALSATGEAPVTGGRKRAIRTRRSGVV